MACHSVFLRQYALSYQIKPILFVQSLLKCVEWRSLLICEHNLSVSDEEVQERVIDLFSLYLFFPHFRPCDVLMGILLQFFHKLCELEHEHKTTFERNYSIE